MKRPGLFLFPPPASPSPGWGLLAICFGTLVVPFDSAVNVAFPQIVHAFGLPISAIQWVIIAYTLTYAALMLVFGRIGDMLGHRRVFLLGSAWSAIALGLCAAASSFPWLLLTRALQGVGAALVLSCGPALATGLFPEEQRPRVLGLYTMVFSIGAALGPLIAGVVIQRWDWPAVFWFRAPVAFVALVLTSRLPASGHSKLTARFDWAGAALLVMAIAALLLGLNQLQNLRTNATAAGACAIIALFSGTWFVRHELRTREPIIELRFFRDPDFSILNVAHLALSTSSFAILLLVPFLLDRLSGVPVPAQGGILAVASAGTMITAPAAGRLLQHIPAPRLALLGAVAMAAGQALVCFIAAPLDLSLLAAGMFLQGGGIGVFQVAYFEIATATIPQRDRGVAGSLVMMTRTLGIVVGATVLTMIFQVIRASGLQAGMPDTEAFLAGFRGAFLVAFVLPALVAVIAIARGWHRRARTGHGLGS
ncbi:MAG: MFS transporter [Acetobacteraceae bacterium]|nr:MFS transporter [Acetobacteraceae bacterium]